MSLIVQNVMKAAKTSAPAVQKWQRAALEGTLTEWRELVKMQLHRPASWQIYIFFPPKLQGKTTIKGKIKCFLK